MSWIDPASRWPLCSRDLQMPSPSEGCLCFCCHTHRGLCLCVSSSTSWGGSNWSDESLFPSEQSFHTIPLYPIHSSNHSSLILHASCPSLGLPTLVWLGWWGQNMATSVEPSVALLVTSGRGCDRHSQR